MDPRLAHIRLVVVLAGALAALFFSNATATAGQLLYPDLVTRPIASSDLAMSKPGSKHPKLELTNEVANKGLGPVEITASAASHNCDHDGNPNNDRDALQTIYSDDGSGVFERGQDTPLPPQVVACERQLDTYYWQIWNLARYRLLSPRTGEVVAQTHKVAYCTVDVEIVFRHLPGFSDEPYYPTDGCGPDSTLGISVGWADVYSIGTPGQQIGIKGLKAGRYCLTSEANPKHLLIEGNSRPDPYSNNLRDVLIALHPKAGNVKRLGRDC
jgi:Lysyl oxidase